MYHHTTTATNLPGILAEGLLTSKSTGKEAAVWLHVASKTHWAIAHVQRRHGVTLDQVVVLEVQVPRSWLRRAWKGLWKCGRDVPPARHTRKGELRSPKILLMRRRMAHGRAVTPNGFVGATAPGTITPALKPLPQ
jgi:hypothetical protein